MKLKTFFKSYILIMSVLLAAIFTISIYFTNYQMRLIHEQSVFEYERIISIFERDINNLYARGEQDQIPQLIESHLQFYREYYLSFNVSPIIEFAQPRAISFFNSDDMRFMSFWSWPNDFFSNSDNVSTAHELSISGRFRTDYSLYEISLAFNVTDQIFEIQRIQRTLLLFFVIFSLISASFLYKLLNKIFQPFELVSQSAEKIASGDYTERIQIEATDELATMANNFNQMSEEIEKHIIHLKGETERKQQFIDNLAHELRTPLTSIYGYAEYMQNVNLTEEDKLESTGFIMEEAGHMRNITNSMLELAKLRNTQPELERIDITNLFSQLETSLEIVFGEKQVEFITHPLDGYILGQGDLIRSLISNLCINALKACEPTVGRVVLRACELGRNIQISVADNGCGIEELHLAKLFEPFYQVDTVRNKKSGGIGLGLAIVKQIVDIHQAELVIESEVGAGTVVKIIFSEEVGHEG